ncbi:MAG: tRNA adenosine(34) deaminase TadA [Thermoguttaceae bacterium]|nr:tRNA adenosine(34) deaminase TadA [Thermoguttaceae bacterium]
MSRRKLTPVEKARREIYSVSCLDILNHQNWMALALEQAQQAAQSGDVPVGAVIVRNGELIAAAGNARQRLQRPTAHAEILAIEQACEKLGTWNLSDCSVYVTLEPCCMCAGAILQARIPLVVYGADDPKAGAVKSLFSLLNDSRLNHRCEVISGILDTACGKVLTDFFQKRRDENKAVGSRQ